MAQGQQNPVVAFSRSEQQRLGLPQGWRKRSIRPFAGLNLSDSRFDIQDSEFAWFENWIRIGAGRLQTTYDIGAPIHTATLGRTILDFQFFTLNGIDYIIVFYNDGTADQVQVSNGETTVVSSTVNTFLNGNGKLPAVAQWGTQYLLISNNNTPNEYWCWDSNILYYAGTIAPSPSLTSAGNNYTSAPTVTAFGGHGSAATFTAQIQDGSVVGVVIDDPGSGYVAEDANLVQLQFSGGGSDTSAILEAALSTGQMVLAIEPVDFGSGYTGTPTVALTGGGGATQPTVTAVLGSGSQSGQIVEFVITAAGSKDFTGTPTVAISGGGGSGATAVATMSGRVVASVSVTDGGTNYEGTPALTFVGGGGTGAAGYPIMTGSVISSVVMTDFGQNYTSAPAVQVAPTNNAAAATVQLMPYGVSGSALQSYLSRVVLLNPYSRPGFPSNGGTRLFSAPDSFTDFATSDGGLISPTTETALLKAYTGLQLSGGYLYFFGDTSISVLSTINTGGSPTTTTFNYQTLDTQSGSLWRDSIQSVGRDLIFANATGVWRLYGGTPTKLSEKIDPLFTGAPAGVVPTAAVTTFMSRRLYLLNFTIVDQTGTIRTVLLGLDEGRWYVFSQSIQLTYIATYQKGAEPQAYGTDGTAIWPLLASPSATLNKIIWSKLWGIDTSELQREGRAWFLQAANLSGNNITVTLNIDTEDAIYPVPNGPISYPYNGPGANLAFGPTGDIVGSEIGFELTTSEPDMQLYDFGLASIDIGAVAGNM